VLVWFDVGGFCAMIVHIIRAIARSISWQSIRFFLI
jgi:hypothetical protein